MSGLLGVAIVVLAWVVLIVGWLIVVHGGTRNREADDQMAAEALTFTRLLSIPIVESKAAPAEHAYYAAVYDPHADNFSRYVLMVGSDVARRMRARGVTLYDRPL